jgi:cation diffusion facilitator CzcD-associated flavoprotein CzcO
MCEDFAPEHERHISNVEMSFSPAHVYTYSFEPNPDWSSFYASAAEIRAYFEKFAEKHNLMPFVKLNSKVLSAIWDEDKGICEYHASLRS